MTDAPWKPRTRPARLRNATLVLMALCALPLLAAVQFTSAQSGHTLAKDSISASPFHHLDFGTAGDVTDDCFYADMQPPSPMPGAPTSNDLRLTHCSGKAAFSLVGDADVSEKGFASGPQNKAPSVRVAYGDVNANGFRDLGDYIYLTTSPAPQLEGSSGSTVTIRLTNAGGKAAGTLVDAGDSDRVTFATIAPSISGSWAWHDQDGNTYLSSADSLYFLPGVAPGYAAGNPIPNDSLLIRGPSSPPTTSSVPVQQPVLAESTRSVTPTRWLDFGSLGQATDDCFYGELKNPNPAPSQHDLRLVACQGKAAFSLVRDTDSSEVGYGSGPGNRAPSVRVAYADINNNGQHDADDWIYITTESAPRMQATNQDGFTIRLKAAYSQAAGTIVKAGDPDYTAYSQVAYHVEASYGWSDDDKNSALSEGDNVYLIFGYAPGTAAGNPIPSGSLLLHRAGPIETTVPTTPTSPSPGSTTTATSPTPTSQAKVHVEGRSVSFSAMSGAVGEPVTVYARVKNPTPLDADLDLVLETSREATHGQSMTQRVQISAGHDHILQLPWTPNELGDHLVRAYLASTSNTRSDLGVALGASQGDQTTFWVGTPPSGQPLLLLTSDVGSAPIIEENQVRSVPVDVTAYNVRAQNVRIDVFRADGVRVRSLTPAMTIEAGATVRFYLEVRANELAGNQTVGGGAIVFRALSDGASSNVDTLDVAIHEKAPASIPAFGPLLAAVAVATAGALAACFRRRD